MIRIALILALLLSGCGKVIFYEKQPDVYYQVFVSNSDGTVIAIPLTAEVPVSEKYDTSPNIPIQLEVPLIKGRDLTQPSEDNTGRFTIPKDTQTMLFVWS